MSVPKFLTSSLLFICDALPQRWWWAVAQVKYNEDKDQMGKSSKKRAPLRLDHLLSSVTLGQGVGWVQPEGFVDFYFSRLVSAVSREKVIS